MTRLSSRRKPSSSYSAMAFSLKLLKWRIRKLVRVRDRFDQGDDS
ncbi:hypothetical protein FRUB_05851 [Fimbriiglobus ruber]|uniref:Uncharacterized protein n=1 Tax=Fimbriiglobus ruber TaxID=1908690 RepID=A0A225DEH7_9BACT|nr:hypothetical protein FRUB_05851 [Fimbriiglobus ruber]